MLIQYQTCLYTISDDHTVTKHNSAWTCIYNSIGLQFTRLVNQNTTPDLREIRCSRSHFYRHHSLVDTRHYTGLVEPHPKPLRWFDTRQRNYGAPQGEMETTATLCTNTPGRINRGDSHKPEIRTNNPRGSIRPTTKVLRAGGTRTTTLQRRVNKTGLREPNTQISSTDCEGDNTKHTGNTRTDAHQRRQHTTIHAD